MPMDRSAPKHTPQAHGAQPHGASEIQDGLVLALLARKRLLVLVGEAGSGRSSVYRQLVERVASDGAMVLPVAATAGAQIEDLILEACAGALPDAAGEDGEADFDALISALEERLDLAGTGLLAVENAGLLAPPVLADLVEMTRSETASGRFLQVLLCGTPDLERMLVRAGLTDSLRELGVIYRMSPDAAPSTTPSAPAVPPRRASQPANDWAKDWAADDDWTDRGTGTGAMMMPGPPDATPQHPAATRAPRRAALYAGAALTTLMLLAAAGAAVVTSVPGLLPDSAAAALERGWHDTRTLFERSTRGLLGGDGDALSLGATRAAQAEQPTLQPQHPAPQTPAPQTPAPPIQTAALPPPAAAPTVTVPAAPAPANSEAAPGTAALPPLEEPSAGASPPQAPTAFDGDAGLAQRTRALVEQARRQIAGKRLTTPPGDNAYETVQRLRQTAPNAPEAAELTATMEDTYRRWAMLAERDGDWNEARRFYERAQMISPNNAELGERIRAAGERRSLGAPPATLAPAAPATTAPGLNGRESVLALLRNPAELTRALQSGVAPDTRLDNGKTLLMVAAEQGLTDAARILLDRRARTDLRSSDGATAVMYAAWGGYESVVGALADGGADLDATNDDGKTALMAAAARGHTGVAQVLLQRGVAVDRTTANGWSALMYAANNGHERAAKLLLDQGANPYRMDTNGNSALTLGALQGHVQVVEALKPR